MANVSKLRLNGISYDIKDNNAREQLTLIQNQFNQLIAPSGEAPNPAQVQNARIGVDGVVYDTLGNAIRTQINNLNNIIVNNGGGFSTDAKMALLTCFQKVAWIDDQGQIYYNALYNSLFPTAISISVTFNSASHIFYDTDTLNDLRPYLTVKATLPDSTTEIITNYSLRGSMTAGTNIITVQYQGLTDTFSVTTSANPSYITAAFTQPQTTIYTDDGLDILKSNLVVTFFKKPGEAGTVLADSAYILDGILTEGTNVITVGYQGLTATFNVTDVVDFYNVHVRALSLNNLLKVNGGTDSNIDASPTRARISALDNPNIQRRRTALVDRGKARLYRLANGSSTEYLSTDYYPIPVPMDANHVKITMEPTGQDIYAHFIPYNASTQTYGDSTLDNRITWTTLQNGTVEKNLVRSDSNQLFMLLNMRYNSSTTGYPVEPTAIMIEFSEV